MGKSSLLEVTLCEKCGIWSAMKIKVNMNSVNNLFQASEGKKCSGK